MDKNVSKKLEDIFIPNLKFKYMYEAYARSAENKHKNKEVILYELDLANNITQTLKRLYDGTYKVGKYNEFIVTIPKQRTIKALPFHDRIVQQWYVEQFIKPIFIPKFIVDTYACIPGRGVHKAVKKLNRYMYNTYMKNKDAYILKCDISKFFYSIDKRILYNIIKKKVKDKRFLQLTKQFIYDTNENIGIPIGNYTSQYFANIYMDKLDHFIKEECKVKYYIRYVDDFVLILENKEICKKMKKEIEDFLANKLNLKLNKKTNYSKISEGVNFLGYKVFPNCIKLKNTNKKKIYKVIRKYNKWYEKKNFNEKDAMMSLNSWIGHAKNADTYNLIKDVIKRCNWIYDEKVDIMQL
jgi:RNA-directed DNA polymerase